MRKPAAKKRIGGGVVSAETPQQTMERLSGGALKSGLSACRVVDLAENGPVRMIVSKHGAGLLVHHQKSDRITMQSMAGSGGFSLSRDAARQLSKLLSEWAGPEIAAESWSADGDTWALAVGRESAQ